MAPYPLPWNFAFAFVRCCGFCWCRFVFVCVCDVYRCTIINTVFNKRHQTFGIDTTYKVFCLTLIYYTYIDKYISLWPVPFLKSSALSLLTTIVIVIIIVVIMFVLYVFIHIIPIYTLSNLLAMDTSTSIHVLRHGLFFLAVTGSSKKKKWIR